MVFEVHSNLKQSVNGEVYIANTVLDIRVSAFEAW